MNETNISDTEGSNVAEDINSPSMFEDTLQFSSSGRVNSTPVSRKIERKPSVGLGITVADVMGGVEMGSKFNSDSITSGGEKVESDYVGTNYLTPPLNLIMKPVSKYQASNEIWLSSSFSSHQLGYKLCLMVKIPPQSGTKLNDDIQLEVGVASAQKQQDSFLRFPCIGDAKVKILNPHWNEGHKEISMGFMIHNERHNAHSPKLSYPMIVPKEFVFKDRLFFHVVAVQLGEEYRPWLLDPGLVAEDNPGYSDTDSECNVVY